MKTHPESALFTRPLSRRMYHWLLFLSPVAALLLRLLARAEPTTAAAAKPRCA